MYLINSSETVSVHNTIETMTGHGMEYLVQDSIVRAVFVEGNLDAPVIGDAEPTVRAT